MKKVSIFAVFGLLLLCLGSCRIISNEADGPQITKQYQVSPFKGIRVSGPHDVYFEQSDTVRIYAIVPENRQNELNIVTEEGILTISKKAPEGVIRIGDTSWMAEIHIQAPSLSQVKLNGSGTFECKDSLKASQFTVTINGSGDIRLGSVDCERADLSVVGSGSIVLGMLTAKASEIQIAGSGDITMREKGIATTTMTIAGSGDIDMTLDDCHTAIANIAGSGDITLQGTLRSLQKNVSGSGSISTDKLTINKQ